MDPPQQRPPRLQAILRTVISFTFRSQGIHGSETRHSRGAMPCRTGRKTRRRDPIGCHWRMVLLGRRVIACVVANRAMNRLTAYVVADRAYAYSELFLPSAWKSCCGVSLGRERDWMASGGKSQMRDQVLWHEMNKHEIPQESRLIPRRMKWHRMSWDGIGSDKTKHEKRLSQDKMANGMRRQTMRKWNDMKWAACIDRAAVTADAMRCNEILGFYDFFLVNEMTWGDVEMRQLDEIDMRRHWIRWGEMRMDEMRWAEKKQRRHEMRWDEMGWHRLRWQPDARSNFQENVRCNEIRWNDKRFSVQKAWHQIDKSRACCCEAQESCQSPIGTDFAPLYRL